MQKSQHGKWMTTNQVLISTNANEYIVHTINRCSKTIRDNLKLYNDAVQPKKDVYDMS